MGKCVSSGFLSPSSEGLEWDDQYAGRGEKDPLDTINVNILESEGNTMTAGWRQRIVIRGCAMSPLDCDTIRSKASDNGQSRFNHH